MCKKLLTLLGITAILTGCSSTEDDPYVERSVEELYNGAADLYNDGSYTKAATEFAEVERQHPYSPWALKAMLRSGEAYYQAKKYEDAIENFKVFAQLHPAHKDVAYAQYMIGICYYEQIASAERDQQMTELALEAFENVTRLYPATSYAKDAKVKIALLNDQLAGKEMAIARFYLKERSYLAAINRLRYVIQHYQTTVHPPEALYRLVEANFAYGLYNEAREVAAVLGHNYPGSNWYQDAYELIQKHAPPKQQQPALKQQPAPKKAAVKKAVARQA